MDYPSPEEIEEFLGPPEPRIVWQCEQIDDATVHIAYFPVAEIERTPKGFEITMYGKRTGSPLTTLEAAKRYVERELYLAAIRGEPKTE